MLRPLVCGLLSLGLIAPIDAQDAPPVMLTGSQQFDVTASANGRTYRLYVAPSVAYVKGDATRYPVSDLLDGHFAFPAAIAAREYIGLCKELEHVIIVGRSCSNGTASTAHRCGGTAAKCF